MSVNYAVLGAAFIVAGPVTNQIGARWAYAIAAGVILVGAAVGWLLLRGAESVQPVARTA